MKRLRRTMLFVPGNNPGMIKDAGIYRADCVMFDLEDSVSVHEKDAARFLVREALTSLDYPDVELVVRINPPDARHGVDDLEAVVRTRKAVIRLPKTESAEDLHACERHIARIEREAGIETGTTRMMAAVETAGGVLNAREIALSSPRLVGVALGAEDYVTDLGTTRSPDGTELLAARSMILLAARAAGIDAIDTVFTDINDEDGLRRETELVKQLGFNGKSVINPRQIKIVHDVFTPTRKDVEKALAIMDAIEEANSRGVGVLALSGKMIDKVHVTRAENVLGLARAAGLIAGRDAPEE